MRPAELNAAGDPRPLQAGRCICATSPTRRSKREDERAATAGQRTWLSPEDGRRPGGAPGRTWSAASPSGSRCWAPAPGHGDQPQQPGLSAAGHGRPGRGQALLGAQPRHLGAGAGRHAPGHRHQPQQPGQSAAGHGRPGRAPGPTWSAASPSGSRCWAPQHPDTATSLNNLGMLLQAMGDLAGARPYLERSLAIREQVLGASTRTRPPASTTWACCCRPWATWPGAGPTWSAASPSGSRCWAPSTRTRRTSLNNLGSLLQAMGDLAGARPY